MLIARVNRKSPGTVTFLQGNLADLPSIGDDTIDAVVSISALEHNELEAISGIVSSLYRVLKPGGRLLATMAASGDVDWYHDPSHGWVLTPQTICALFGVPDAQLIGFEDYEECLRQLSQSQELKKGLAEFFFSSGENGMPWGVWNPCYVPVAVSLVKSSERKGTPRC
jgi:ubiquinone/menaquinone biosynthesis C-methylase UbiE